MHLLTVSTKKLPVLLPLALCIATAVCAGGVAHAGAVGSTVLDFEDLSGDEGWGRVPDGYEGFTWGNAGWITKDKEVPSGYQNTIEGRVGIFTYYATTLSMASSPFDLIGCKLGAAWKPEQGVTFEGKRDGVTVYSVPLVASYESAYVELNFQGVDQVLVTPDTQGDMDHVVLDNIEVIVAASPVTTELVAADVSGNVGQTVQLSATLTAGGVPVGGKTVDFQVDGVPAGSATTDQSGVARVAHTILSMGDKVIGAGFAGDGTYLPSEDAANLAVYNAGGAGLILAWDKDDCNFYLCADPADPQAAGDSGRIPAAANGTFTVNGVSVTVRGSTSNLTVSVNNAAGITNALRVRWYARGGVVSQAYAYSTIANEKRNATFTSGRTFVDGQYKTGFWGLTHAVDGVDPASIAYGAVQQ